MVKNIFSHQRTMHGWILTNKHFSMYFQIPFLWKQNYCCTRDLQLASHQYLSQSYRLNVIWCEYDINRRLYCFSRVVRFEYTCHTSFWWECSDAFSEKVNFEKHMKCHNTASLVCPVGEQLFRHYSVDLKMIKNINDHPFPVRMPLINSGPINPCKNNVQS